MKDILISDKKFPLFLGFTAMLIAFCAAGFSVYGIGSLFAGASISAMIMATSLEIGKLMSTTFLYRYWDKAEFFIKFYLTLAVIVLMIITSAGIFGFLSSAYQKSSLEFKLQGEKIVSIEKSKGFYTNQINTSEKRIQLLNETRVVQEARLSEALTNVFLIRNPIQLQQIQQQTIKLIDQSNEDIKNENLKIDGYRNEIFKVEESVNNLKINSVGRKDIQTFKFLADALNTDLDTVAKWFIISLIFVFDPLAIVLILAYNVSVSNRLQKEKVEEQRVVKNKEDEQPKELEEVDTTPVDSTQNLEVIGPIEQSIVDVSTKTELTEGKLEKISEPVNNPSEMDPFYKRFFKQ